MSCLELRPAGLVVAIPLALMVVFEDEEGAARADVRSQSLLEIKLGLEDWAVVLAQKGLRSSKPVESKAKQTETREAAQTLSKAGFAP